MIDLAKMLKKWKKGGTAGQVLVRSGFLKKTKPGLGPGFVLSKI
jgi:hypothetical protein